MGIENLFTEEAYTILKNLEFKTFLNRFEQFQKNQKTKKEINYQTITEPSQFNSIFECLEKQKETAYILFSENNIIKGMSLYDGGENAYFLYCQNNTLDLLQAAKNFFESNEYYKIAHYAKKDMTLLR